MKIKKGKKYITVHFPYLLHILLFLCYTIFLLQMTIFRFPLPFFSSLSVVYSKEARCFYANFIPCHTFIRFIREIFVDRSHYSTAILNLVGNCIIFVPLGYFIPTLWKRLQKWYWIFLLSFLLTILMECTQFWTGLGIFDVDDMIENIIGALLGYAVYAKWFAHKAPHSTLSYLSTSIKKRG